MVDKELYRVLDWGFRIQGLNAETYHEEFPVRLVTSGSRIRPRPSSFSWIVNVQRTF